jgi:hypothetical protein
MGSVGQRQIDGRSYSALEAFIQLSFDCCPRRGFYLPNCKLAMSGESIGPVSAAARAGSGPRRGAAKQRNLLASLHCSHAGILTGNV